MKDLVRKKEYLKTMEGMIDYLNKKLTMELERTDLTEEDLISIEEDTNTLEQIIKERNRIKKLIAE